MEVWKQGAIVALASSGLTFLAGIEQCHEEGEVCDGIDNDGDGQVDEDFDEDLDGFYSELECDYGNDCNDTDPKINPAAQEQDDGLDNDCDGKIDEDDDAYTLTFVASYTGVAIEGVSVWDGADGKGWVQQSDRNGNVTFYSDTGKLTVSWANSYSKMSSSGDTYIYRYIYSNQNLDPLLQPVVTLYRPDLSTGSDAYLSGNISGVDTTLDSMVWTRTDKTSAYSWDPLEPTFYEMYMPDYGDWLLATQSPYSESLGYSYAAIPTSFAFILDPSNPTDVTLDRTFDRNISFNFNNVDNRMALSFHDETFTLPNGGGSLFFSANEYALSDSASRSIQAPTPSGSLAGTQMELRAALLSSDESLAQLSQVYWDGVSPAVDAYLPTIHTVAPYDALTLETLEGTSLTYEGDSGSDLQKANYLNYRYSDSTRTYLRNIWVATQTESSDRITFLPIPNGAAPWIEASDPADLLSQLSIASSSIVIGIEDSIPGYQMTSVTLETADPTTRSSLSGLRWADLDRLPKFKHAR